MKIYHYHPATGVYLGEGIADKCPVSGVDLIPAFATAEAPPAAGENQYAAFENGAWVIKDVPQPDPEPEPTPAEAATAKRTAINAERNRREAASPFAYDVSEFDYDGLSRDRINAAVSAATIAALSGTPASTVVCTWTLYDNTTRNMTVADWLAFRQAEVARSGALHETARTLKAAVDAALVAGATAEEIDAMPVWTE